MGFLTNGQNVLYTETFSDCAMPSNWETMVEYGGVDWEVVDNNHADPDYGDECLLYFLDIKKQGKGDSSNIWVASPWIQPINSDSVFIDFLLNYIKINGKPQVLDIYYEVNNQRHLYASFDSTVWGATFNEYVPQTIRIANTDNSPVRVVINFNNHGEQNSVVSLDNFVFRGYSNNQCDAAVDLSIGATGCLEGNNFGLNAEIVPDACSGIQTTRPIWYRFISDRTAFIKLSTQAEYNDVIDVYYGICDDLIPFRCSNKDEYGFTGEEMYFRVTNGVVYYFRLSAYDAPYSTTDGKYCIRLEEVPEIPKADNYDYCTGAQELTLDGDCVESLTYFAETTDPVPSLNEKSRADVWYKYTHSTDVPITFNTNADFSDVITIYQGNCFGLLEVSGTDQGPEMVGFELTEGIQYFIKISGYFSTIEGKICASISTAAKQNPENDYCDFAEEVTLNEVNCLEASTIFARTSNIKSSCQIKAGPDLWYQFVPPGSGAVSIQVNAEFIYDLALYLGTCDSLVEQNCQMNPHRCDGYINFENLNPDTTYYLQISAHVNSFGSVRGDLCLSIFNSDDAPPFAKLTVNSELNCKQDILGILSIEVEGGQGIVDISGNQDGDWILPGENYRSIIQDEAGCRQIIEGIAVCEGNIDCDNSDLELTVSYDCELDALGLQTGRAIVSVEVSGGIGNVERFGIKDGDIVDSGTEISIAALDEGGCMKIYRELIICDPFTCEQSDLNIIADYNCIDSLLRAELIINAADGNGQYSFSGHRDGDLLEDGDSYLSIVTDEAGCTDTISGIIDCQFDSCAYSALDVNIDYECLKDINGNQTGKAILSIITNGGIGQLTFIGSQSGDTLNNGDNFDIEVVDEWGCSIVRQGTIECIPTSNRDPSAYKFRNVYPMPTSNYVIVEYHSSTKNEVEFDLFDSAGKLVWSHETICQSGINSLPLVFGPITKGVYQLRAIEKGDSFFAKIVIAD
jgi:hypothetical protein